MGGTLCLLKMLSSFIHYCQKQRCSLQVYNLFWISICSGLLLGIYCFVVKNSAKIAVRDAKLFHHKLLPFICLHWVADTNVVSAGFLDITSQNVFTVSLRVCKMHRFYFHCGVLSCRYCICSVEIMFIVMFMHRNQLFNCHRAPASECKDFNFVADHLTISPDQEW